MIMRAIKVDKRNLYILDEKATVKQMCENRKMEFAVTRVIQLVVDEAGKLKGVISDYNKNSDQLKDYINYNFLFITEGEKQNTKTLAETMLALDNYYLIPVVDKDGYLLYAYQECNMGVNALFNAIEPRFDFEAVMALGKQYEIWEPDKKIYICSNLGKCESSVTEEEISRLEKNSIVIIGYEEDYLAMQIVKKCIENGIYYQAFVKKKVDRLTNYLNVNSTAMETMMEVAQENGMYLDWPDFETIFQVLEQTKKLSGAYVEIGTYRGDSAKAALEYMKQANINRVSYFLDTYEGFTYATAQNSTDALWKNSHTDTSIELVEYRLKNYSNWKCIKNNIIEETFPEEIGDIAACNIDVDMYDAIYSALNKVKDKIVAGGIILAEDFGHTPQLIGGQYAISKFIEENSDEFTAIYGRGSQLLLIKKFQKPLKKYLSKIGDLVQKK